MTFETLHMFSEAVLNFGMGIGALLIGIGVVLYGLSELLLVEDDDD